MQTGVRMARPTGVGTVPSSGLRLPSSRQAVPVATLPRPELVGPESSCSWCLASEGLWPGLAGLWPRFKASRGEGNGD